MKTLTSCRFPSKFKSIVSWRTRRSIGLKNKPCRRSGNLKWVGSTPRSMYNPQTLLNRVLSSFTIIQRFLATILYSECFKVYTNVFRVGYVNNVCAVGVRWVRIGEIWAGKSAIGIGELSIAWWSSCGGEIMLKTKMRSNKTCMILPNLKKSDKIG